MADASLIRANALRLPLADESVDLIVTSPPYFALRSYQDDGDHYEGQIGSEPTPREFLEALWTSTAECRRVLKPSGSLFVNLGDKYAGSGGHNNSGLGRKQTWGQNWRPHDRAIKATRRNAPDTYNQAADVRDKSLMGLPWLYALGCTGGLTAVDGVDVGLNLILRAEIIWDKPTAMPESVTDRVCRTHEQWFHFTKEPKYFGSTDEIRVPHTGHRGNDHKPARSSNGGTNHRALARDESLFDPRGRRPGSVWRISSEALIIPEYVDVDHFAAFPQEWPRKFILGWCPPAGVVLDPFAGTGTVPMVARALGRYGIGVDLSADYLRLARWRVFESGHASKSRERTNREAQVGLAL